MSTPPNESLTVAAATAHTSPREGRLMSAIKERDTAIASMEKKLKHLEEEVMEMKRMKTSLVHSPSKQSPVSLSPRQFTSPVTSHQKYSPVSSHSPRVSNAPAPTTPVQPG